MKKLICLILTVCILFALAACGETKPAEPEIIEWTRQGTYEDESLTSPRRKAMRAGLSP